MERKYRVGFFAAVLAVTALLAAGYYLSYQYTSDKYQTEHREKEEEKNESLTTQGGAEQTEGYYVGELHGYVVVYYQDRQTIYEMTEIPYRTLPDEVQQELREGKYIKTTQELYAFLENYSS